MKNIYTFLLLGFFGVVTSCTDDQSNNPVPAGYLQEMYIDLVDIENAHLKSEGNSRVYLQNGYAGVVVYYSNESTYKAFDAACPHEALRDIYVLTNGRSYDDVDEDSEWVDGTETVANCPECGSIYDLSYGTGGVMSGESSHPLRAYKTARSGDYLRIYSVD